MIERLALKHFERGRQFELQDRLDEAVEAYEKACALEPATADCFLALGRIQAGRGQFQAALELLDHAASRSEDPQIREWRAYVFGRLRRYEEALTDYRAVVDEGDPSVRVNLGRMLLALGRYDEAEATLERADDPAGTQLLRALPRYREFEGARLDDMRTTRYLFGRTLLLGTLGDGGLRPSGHRYLMLSARHVGLTMRRLVTLAEAEARPFEAVAGDGAHHGPVARAAAELLGVPHVARPDDVEPGCRLLLCSAVVEGSAVGGLEERWRRAGAELLHFALGYVPAGDPDEREPALLGFAGRCAVWWYRLEDYSRLVQDRSVEGGPWPGFRVGPPAIDPNVERVAGQIVDSTRQAHTDPAGEAISTWYRRHAQTRARAWFDRCTEEDA